MQFTREKIDEKIYVLSKPHSIFYNNVVGLLVANRMSQNRKLNQRKKKENGKTKHNRMRANYNCSLTCFRKHFFVQNFCSEFLRENFF